MSTAGPATRDRVAVVLSSVLSPARASSLAAEVERTPHPLATALARLRADYGAGDEALVAALDMAGVSVAEAANLLGTDVRAVHRLLDDDLGTDGRVPASPRVPTGLTVAQRLVRVVWVTLAVASLVVLLQARGGLAPCPEDLCVDAVTVELASGATVDPAERSVFPPEEFTGVRFAHRAPQEWTGAVRWTVDGEEVLRHEVVLRGSDTLAVPWPDGGPPLGTHVVTLVGGPSSATATFVIART